ncbi:hypothetical protein Hanom_Chr07g00609741 [Helianthus anomalus]
MRSSSPTTSSPLTGSSAPSQPRRWPLKSSFWILLTKDLDGIDMVVLSIGHWYLHPAVFYYGDSIPGCDWDSLDDCRRGM